MPQTIRGDAYIPDAQAVLSAFEALPVKWGRVPSSEIKAALQARVTCQECGGLLETCSKCNGEKTVPATVPGARLVTGKLRLEVS